MSSATVLTATITVIVALIGFIATYINNLRLNQRQARLERVNQQLSQLYGPLLAIRGASKEAFDHLIQKHGHEGHFFRGRGASEDDLETWRLWITTVFMPGNRRIYELILSRADLLLGNSMPQVLLAFCAHVLAYEVVLAKWERGDFSEYTSVMHFPGELDDYIKRSFVLLKEEQSRLLGRGSLKNLTETAWPL